MKKILFTVLICVLIFIILSVMGCTNLIPETEFVEEYMPSATIPKAVDSKNSCLDCNVECPGADRTTCVDGDICKCYYRDVSEENNYDDEGNNNNKNKANNYSNFNKEPILFTKTLPSCEDRMDFLSIPPLKYSDFQTITPLGNLNPSGHTFPTDHIYLALNRVDTNNWDTGTVNVPLYMPGNAWITQITASKHLSNNPPFTDYDLTFYSCKELSFRFGHITSLSDKLLEQLNEENNCDKEYETGGSRFQRCSSDNLNLKESAGEKIETVGGNPNQNAFDIWATDLRTEELQFANSERWSDEVKHNVCPLDYFIEAEKKNYILYLETGAIIKEPSNQFAAQ